MNFKYTKQYCIFLSYILWFPLLTYTFVSCTPTDNGYQPSATNPSNPIKNVFVGSQNCKTCHTEEYNSWKGSHHDQAMKVADSTTIAGDFNNTKFDYNGINYSFFINNGKYYVNTQDGNGKYIDFEVVHTFGVTPLQQYLVAFPDGSYQCLQVAWDTEKGLWFDLQPDLKIATDEWLHWTRGAMRWNTMCADCHSTDLRKNFDPKTQTYNTKFSEINVACESCHGPAGNHLEYYKNAKEGVDPKLNMTKNMASTEVVDKCARCHSRRGQITTHYDYEGEFLDHYDPSLISDINYEADGQILNEDYVWGSFVQSKMYHNDVSCIDCHDVHSLKLKSTGNQLCIQCHETTYDSPSHHFHKPNTEASQCINCHMTGRTYMGNDYRRDHSFRVPRPDQTVNYGTPNACNNCHQDQSAKWASNFIESKFGKERPKHFSDLLLAGYHGNRNSLEKLISDNSYPAIARATGLHYYGNGIAPQELELVKTSLTNSSALVRNQAAIIIGRVDQGSSIPEMTSLLNDEIRLVRISAARYLDQVDPNAQASALFAKAMKENMDALKMQADFPGGQHAMALYYEGKGNRLAAIDAYKKALEIDNYYNQARMNLAFLLYQGGQTEESKIHYQKVIELEPDFSESYYMLGLLNHELGNTKEALKYLEQACKRLPANDRSFYNFALLLQQENRFEESITAIQEASLTFPNHEELLYVQLIGEIRLDRKTQALLTCQRLISLAPNNPNYQQIKNQISQEK